MRHGIGIVPFAQLSSSLILLTQRFLLNRNHNDSFTFETRKRAIASGHAMIVSIAVSAVMMRNKWKQEDIVHQKDDDARAIVGIEASYMACDLIAEVLQTEPPQSKGIVLHHTGIGLGLVAYFIASMRDRDEGIFFILLFMFMNSRYVGFDIVASLHRSTPFMHLRWYANRSKCSQRQRMAADLFAIVTYFCCRIYVGYYMLKIYGHTRGLSPYESFLNVIRWQ